MFAQSKPEPDERPAQNAAAPEAAPQAPSAVPSPLPESNAEQSYAPIPRARAAPPATDEGLDVPPTLAPLKVETDPANAPAAEVPARPVHFGGRGQWVMMGSSNGASVSYATFSGSDARDLYVGGGIGIDYFVVDSVSIGLDAEAAHRNYKAYDATTLAETNWTQFAGGIRFGVNARLGESISWYPRLTLMLASSHRTVTPISSSEGLAPGPPLSSASVGPAVNLYAPLLLHPASHFVVGFGPRLRHDFAVTRGGPYDGSQSTSLSAEFTVGGWWGGEPSPDTEEDRARSSELKEPEKSAELFGAPGQVVLTSATSASISHQTYSLSKGSETDLTFEPGVDYFVTNSSSIGAELIIGHSSGTELDFSGATADFSSASFGLELRAGYNLALSAIASIWLRGGVGYGSVDSSISSAKGTNQHTRTRGWVDVTAPLLVHPAVHFFIGAGPFLFHELSDRDQYNHENNATKVGLNLVLGGWFGGPQKLATLDPMVQSPAPQR